MRLTELRVEQLPGLDGPLGVEGLLPGMNVIVGPNASGKSSLLRALLALLYPREHEGVIGVQARFTTAAGSELVARRLGQDVAWEQEGRRVAAPALPAYHLVGAYTLRLEDLVLPEAAVAAAKRGPGRPATAAKDDADVGTELDRRIADDIDKQLTGGIDLVVVRRTMGSQAEAGRKLSGAVRAAVKEQKGLEQRRAALRERETGLPALREEREAARHAARLGPVVDDALLLLEAVAAAATLDAELASFPPGLDRLRGDEDRSLAKLQESVRSETINLEDIETELDAVQRSLAAAEARADLSAAEVGLQLERAERLLEHETRLRHKVGERQAVLAQLREVGRRVGSDADAVQRLAEVDVSDVTMQRVEELLQQRQTAAADEQSLLRQRARLGAADAVVPGSRGVAGAALDGSADHLARLRANLLRWLSAPAVEPRRPAWAWGVALALAVAVAAAGSWGAPDTVLLVLAAATLAWLPVAAFLLRPLASAVRVQVEAETDRARALHGVTGPAVWEHAEVADLVAALDAELAQRARSAAAEQQRAEAERTLDADLAAARSRADVAQHELGALRERFGFAVGPEVSLAVWLHAVRDLTRVRTALAGIQAEGGWLDTQVREEGDELRSFLAGAGRDRRGAATSADARADQRAELQADESADESADQSKDQPADRLRAAVRALARVVDQRDADRLRLASLSTDRERSRAALHRLQGERQSLLDGAGLSEGPRVEDELRERVAALAAWREVGERKRAGEARVATLERRLAGAEHLRHLVAAGDRALLEEAAAACEAAQVRSEELGRSIAQTEREIELAASDTSLGLVAARLEAATFELSAHRDEAVRLATAHFLLDEIEAEHETEARPPALTRAATLFERFTRDGFTLRFDNGGGGRRRLAAADSAGRLLALRELSTGTRAQLLIASRLAFALEAEEAAADATGLPFFLDEALTTSDAQRFVAVASAILDVAAGEGRQFIYLSARDDDADMWQRAAAAHGSPIAIVQLGSQGAGSAASPAAS